MTGLTNAQLLLLKTWIVNNRNGVFDQGAADALNQPAAPTFYVYRSSVTMSEIMLNGFAWTEVDALTQGKARIWEWMRDADPVNKAIDPSKPNIRAGINEVWAGSAPKLAVRAAVYLHCQRPATVAEKLLKASGNGTAAAQDGSGPATCGVNAEGLVTVQNVIDSESAA